MTNNGSPGLSYYLPEPDKIRTVLQIPGSHTLYAGPLSCTRRHAIHAMQFGDRKNISFLFITEADVISGRYEELIVQSIGQLLAVVEPSPHIFFIAVFCIDDFLGTDEAALLDTLRKTYPDRQFALEHIDPVTLDEQINMGTRKHANLYSFIKPAAKHDNGINFLGNFVSLEPECEFLSLLRKWGCDPVRELFQCQNYDEYKDLGKS
ncbi:MAG: nitrogen fixation protein NifE, partial [Clostridiales bacterium]